VAGKLAALVDVLRRGIKGEEAKMLEKEEAGGEEKRRDLTSAVRGKDVVVGC
tara:strand:- start:2069 stop:2224 length:156 start_codon:yes stop_codon:yes gene_type:complete